MSNDSDNVVMFPGEFRGTPPTTLAEVRQNLEAVWRVHVDDSMETLFNLVTLNLGIMGFDFDDEKYDKDLAFVAEAMRSLLYKHYKFEHRFQKLAEETFVTDESGETRFTEGEEKAPVLQPTTAEV